MFTYIFFFLDIIFSSLHYLDLYITDTALKVSRSLYCFTTSISHGVENYFPRLWGTSIPRLWGTSICDGIKRPARDACLCMGELQAPPALSALHFVFLITL